MNVPTGPRPGRSRGVVRGQIIETARELFAEHGVTGTSLQTIADAIGVTKAAVYHHFKTKDEILLAVAEDPVRRLETAVQGAEAEKGSGDGLYVLLVQLVDLAIDQRALVRTLTDDPVMAQFVAAHASFRMLMRRMHRLLTRGDSSARARVRAATVAAALNSAAVHPLVVDLDDEALRAHLLECVSEILGVSKGGATK
jgi:AcrR family transcriptional regulator